MTLPLHNGTFGADRRIRRIVFVVCAPFSFTPCISFDSRVTFSSNEWLFWIFFVFLPFLCAFCLWDFLFQWKYLCCNVRFISTHHSLTWRFHCTPVQIGCGNSRKLELAWHRRNQSLSLGFPRLLALATELQRALCVSQVHLDRPVPRDMLSQNSPHRSLSPWRAPGGPLGLYSTDGACHL